MEILGTDNSPGLSKSENLPPEDGANSHKSALVDHSVSGLNSMLEVKLWRNPCWFSFRLNYLALCYNSPCYEWVKKNFGLARPEYVVIFSLALSGKAQASEIVRTSGFPKNTLSRAISRLEQKKLLNRVPIPGRGHALELSKSGEDIYKSSVQVFIEHEKAMLAGMTEEECATLSRLLAKLVIDSHSWPTEITRVPQLINEHE